MSDLKSYNRLKCSIETLCVKSQKETWLPGGHNTGLSIEMSRFHLSNYVAFLGKDYLTAYVIHG